MKRPVWYLPSWETESSPHHLNGEDKNKSEQIVHFRNAPLKSRFPKLVFGGVKNVSAIVSERTRADRASNLPDKLKCNFCIIRFFQWGSPPSQRSGLNTFSEGLFESGKEKIVVFRLSRVGIESPRRKRR